MQFIFMRFIFIYLTYTCFYARRAGAFQFVEMSTDSFLPLPYQIQIIKKNFGIICWRYPQPRKMCKIQVFPVPMAVSIAYYDYCLSTTVHRNLILRTYFSYRYRSPLISVAKWNISASHMNVFYTSANSGSPRRHPKK